MRSWGCCEDSALAGCLARRPRLIDGSRSDVGWKIGVDSRGKWAGLKPPSCSRDGCALVSQAHTDVWAAPRKPLKPLEHRLLSPSSSEGSYWQSHHHLYARPRTGVCRCCSPFTFICTFPSPTFLSACQLPLELSGS